MNVAIFYAMQVVWKPEHNDVSFLTYLWYIESEACKCRDAGKMNQPSSLCIKKKVKHKKPPE